MYVFICGGHHDSDRMAVLVMVSKAERIVLCILAKIDLLPSFPQRFAPGINADKDKANCIMHAYSACQKKKFRGVR